MYIRSGIVTYFHYFITHVFLFTYITSYRIWVQLLMRNDRGNFLDESLSECIVYHRPWCDAMSSYCAITYLQFFLILKEI